MRAARPPLCSSGSALITGPCRGACPVPGAGVPPWRGTALTALLSALEGDAGREGPCLLLPALLQRPLEPGHQAPAGSRISQRDWLRVHPRHWELLRPPTAAELARLHTELSEHRGGPSRSSSPALEATAIDQVSSELRRAEDVIRRLMACPLCRKTRRVSFEPRDRGTFRCLCADCGGQWGTRICGARQHVFPVLTDGKPVSTDAEDSDQDPYDTGDKIDARFGSEVLALPYPSFPDWTRFRCPWCGICQGSPSPSVSVQLLRRHAGHSADHRPLLTLSWRSHASCENRPYVTVAWTYQHILQQHKTNTTPGPGKDQHTNNTDKTVLSSTRRHAC